MQELQIRCELNGSSVAARVSPNQTLAEVLREQLGATEVKLGCGEGVCGTCTVLLDGESVSSCTIFAVQVDGCVVTTATGLSAGDERLHPLQESFLAYGAAQCGFCTPGMLLSAYELIRDVPDPGRESIRRALAGNLCRCTGYTKILDAVEAYARVQAADAGSETA